MADSNDRNSIERYELAEDDPFAELTRIMGHDPRNDMPSDRTDSASNLALELENELIGGLAGEGELDAFDPSEQAGGQPIAHNSDISTKQPDLTGALEALFEEQAAFNNSPAQSNPSSLSGYAGAPSQPVDEDFSFDHASFAAGEGNASVESEQEPAALDEMFFADFNATDHPEQELSPAESNPELAATSQLVDEDFNFDHASFAAAEGEAFVESEQEPAVPEEVFFADFNAANHSEQALSPAESNPEPAAPSQSVDENFNFDHAFAAGEGKAFVESEHEPAAPEEMFFADFNIADGPAPQHFQAESEAEPATAIQENEAGRMAAGSWHDERFQEQEAVAAVPVEFRKNGEQTANFSFEPSEIEQEFSDWPETSITEQDLPVDEAYTSRQDETAYGEYGNDSFVFSEEESGVPLIETVEVPEAAVPLTEPLDIPDVPFREEVKPAVQFDEIEEILAGAFGETDPSADTWAETSHLDEGDDEQPDVESDDYLAAEIAAAAGFAAGVGGAEMAAANAGDRWDTGLDRPAPLTPEPGVQPPVQARRRIGKPVLIGVGVLAAIAFLGGGAMFLAFVGEDSEPVVIAADNSPIKVRPENPGGIQIPNQDNQVYKRVAGEAVQDTRPEQAELISTTEEPVELRPLPGVEELEARLPSEPAAPEEGTDSQEAVTDRQDAVEVAERLINTAAEKIAPQEEIAALTPRRVRSLVVLPDGSIVPNTTPAQPQPAEAEQAASEAPASAIDTAAQGASEQQAVENQQTAPSDALSDSTQPAEPAPLPSSRPSNIAAAPADPAPAQPAETAAAPVAPSGNEPQVSAVAPPSGQQAAIPSSEWSVQIASQPTVEGAQQSYQQLAQRFGSILEGKGVNIVKADIEGKGTYYRVRIPSPSKDDAIQLCTQLKSAGGSCFVSQ